MLCKESMRRQADAVALVTSLTPPPLLDPWQQTSTRLPACAIRAHFVAEVCFVAIVTVAVTSVTRSVVEMERPALGRCGRRTPKLPSTAVAQS